MTDEPDSSANICFFRTFSDILADETQFQAFKKYLRGKDQAQILSFCEDVQDARRVENSSDRDMIVQKIVEYHFKAGGMAVLLFLAFLIHLVCVDFHQFSGFFF